MHVLCPLQWKSWCSAPHSECRLPAEQESAAQVPVLTFVTFSPIRSAGDLFAFINESRDSLRTIKRVAVGTNSACADLQWSFRSCAETRQTDQVRAQGTLFHSIKLV